jgi:hypothetical protein
MQLKRYVVVFVLFILAMITSIDRVCISAAKEPISSELHLPDAKMGLVFSTFALDMRSPRYPPWGSQLSTINSAH